jgi:recombination protein RecA
VWEVFVARDILDKLLVMLRKKFGTDAAVRLVGDDSFSSSEVREAVPTGLSVLDHYVFAVGGLPIGRVTELAGDEAAGKTSLALAMLGAAQRAGALAVLVDGERAFDAQRARVFGVRAEDLLIAQPEHAESAIESIKLSLRANDPRRAAMVIVFDSLAAMPLRLMRGREAGDVVPGEYARLMAVELPKLVTLLQERRGHLVIVNQVRDKIGIMWGDKRTTPGGRALKFHASHRCFVSSGKAIKDGKTNQHTGKFVTITCVKSKFSPPFRKAVLRLDYATGWNEEWSTLEHGKTFGVVKARNAQGSAARGRAAYLAALKALDWPDPGVTVQSSESKPDDGGEE